MLDYEAIKLMGKKAKLDSSRDVDLPLLINEDWGSDTLKKAYNDRLKNALKRGTDYGKDFPREPYEEI